MAALPAPHPARARARGSLVVLCQHFAPEPIGSAEFCSDAVRWWTEAGFDVTVLTNHPYYPDLRLAPGYDGRVRTELLDGARVHRLRTLVPRSGAPAWRLASELVYAVQAVWTLLRRRARRAELVVSFMPGLLPALLAPLYQRPGGTRGVVVHDIPSGLASGLGLLGGAALRLLRAGERAAFRGAAGVVVLSEHMRVEVARLGASAPVHVVPIWLAHHVAPLALPPQARRRVQYSGNLGTKQGLGQLLDLAAELTRRAADVELLVRGAGGGLERLRHEVTRRGLSNVRFADLVPKERLSAALADCAVHLVPQDPGGAAFAVPSKVYNIMAARRPIVATAEPGSPLALLAARSGGLRCVPPFDAVACADVLLSLLDDPAMGERVGRAGQRYVERHHRRDLVLAELTLRLGLGGSASRGRDPRRTRSAGPGPASSG